MGFLFWSDYATKMMNASINHIGADTGGVAGGTAGNAVFEFACIG